MASISPRSSNSGFKVVPLWDLAAGHKELEADVQDGFGSDALENKGRVSKDELKRILDRIAGDLKRLESVVRPEQFDTTPELCLDQLAANPSKDRSPSATMIVDRLSRLVETIHTLEANAYDSGQYPMAEGLSTLGQRFEETLWMMVVNIRDSILSNPNAGTNPGPPAGPNT